MSNKFFSGQLRMSKTVLLALSLGCFGILVPASAAIKQPDFINTEETLDRALTAYEKGYQHYRYGEFEKSEDSFKEALHFEPNLIKAHYWLGKLYREMGRLDDALFHWEEVERLNKLISDRRNALKIETNEYPDYMQRKKTSETIKKAREHYERAMVLLDDGHWDGAEIEMDEAIKLYPGNAKYVLQMARILWDKEEFQASVKFYRDLLFRREVKYEHFKEGAQRMLKADMDYVLAPLVSKHKIRFANEPGFQELVDHFVVKDKALEPVAAGKIIRRMDGQVILNIGMDEGLNLADEFRLNLRAYRQGEKLKDPDDGRELGYCPDRPVADLLLTKVYKNTSWALIRKEFGTGLKAGDLIEFKKTR